MRLYLLVFLWLLALTANALERPSAENTAKEALAQPTHSSVVVIPINEAIDKANLFILRRALKQAISDQVDCVILDMDTPGGRLDVTLEMMEMLARFEGKRRPMSMWMPFRRAPSLRRPRSRFILRQPEKWGHRRSFRVGVPKSLKRQP